MIIAAVLVRPWADTSFNSDGPGRVSAALYRSVLRSQHSWPTVYAGHALLGGAAVLAVPLLPIPLLHARRSKRAAAPCRFQMRSRITGGAFAVVWFSNAALCTLGDASAPYEERAAHGLAGSTPARRVRACGRLCAGHALSVALPRSLPHLWTPQRRGMRSTLPCRGVARSCQTNRVAVGASDGVTPATAAPCARHGDFSPRHASVAHDRQPAPHDPHHEGPEPTPSYSPRRAFRAWTADGAADSSRGRANVAHKA